MSIKVIGNIKTFIVLMLFLSSSAFMHAQSDNQLIRKGNKEFEQENYQDAEIHYRRALEENPNNSKALYNLANSLYRQGRFDESINILDGLSQKDLGKISKSDVYHNLGNAQLGEQQIRESIDSYKNALKLDPTDHDTRYNLAYAMNLLDEMEQQQQDDPENGEDEQEQEQEQPERDEEGEQQPEQDEQQPMPDQISQEDAERILDALNQMEQKIQEEIKREESEVPRVKPEREW